MTKHADGSYVDERGVYRDAEGREIEGFMTEAHCLELMIPLVRDGFSDRKIADAIGITQHVVEMMKRKHKAKFCHA